MLRDSSTGQDLADFVFEATGDAYLKETRSMPYDTIELLSGAIGFLLDYEAAQYAALAFADTAIMSGRTYRYLLRPSSGPAVGPLTISTNAPTAYPPPQSLAGQWRRRDQVDLRWDRAATDASYFAYVVQRRDLDSVAWREVTEVPLMQLYADHRPTDTLLHYVDTSAVPERDYVYRVFGYTPFGHRGPASDTVVVRAKPRPLLAPPDITRMLRVVDTLFRIEWSVDPAADAGAVAHFEILAAASPYETPAPISGPLPAEAREHLLVDPPDGRYLTVVLVDANGTRIPSASRVMRALDVRAPSPPTGLRGAIDSAGVVRLAWTPSPEADVAGYRVFRANRPGGYFPQLTPAATPASAWVDTVTMATLAEEVYYRILAVDYAGNYSAESETLEVSRPDLHPPVKPLIRAQNADTAGVYFSVAPSPSADVVAYYLERAALGGADTAWAVLEVAAAAEVAARRGVDGRSGLIAFADTSGVPGRTYRYRFVAEDDAGWRTPTPALAASRTDNGRRAPVAEFAVRQLPGTEAPTLSWRYPAGRGLRGFQVYRADASSPTPLAYKLLTARSPELRFLAGRYYFLDATATDAGEYAYQILARHRDGGTSEFTPLQTVTVR